MHVFFAESWKSWQLRVRADGDFDLGSEFEAGTSEMGTRIGVCINQYLTCGGICILELKR